MSNHVSRSLVDHYGIDPDRVRRVCAGSNVDFDSAGKDSLPSDHAGKQILFVGGDWERKGGPDLIAAFGIVRERHPDATLVVAGCSPKVDAEGVTVLGEVSPRVVSE